MTEAAAGSSQPPTGNRRGRDTRRRILAAATERFEIDGIDLTLDDVARTAGTTRMTVHRHTGGREALLTDLVLRATVDVAAEVAAVLDADEPLAARLGDAMVLTVSRVRAAPHLLGLLTGADVAGTWPTLDPDARVLSAIHAFYLPYLRAAEGDGALRAGADEVVDWLLRQTLLLLLLPEAAPDDDSVRWQVERFVLPAVLRSTDA